MSSTIATAVDLTGHDPSADDIDRVTLSGTEIVCVAEQLLGCLSREAESVGSSVPGDWHVYQRDRWLDRLEQLIGEVRGLEAALDAEEPIDVRVPIGWLRDFLNQAVSDYRGQMSTAARGDYCDNVVMFDKARSNLAAAVNILDRIGWPQDAEDVDEHRRFAEALA